MNIVPMIAPKCASPNTRGRISGSKTGPPAEPTNQHITNSPIPSHEPPVTSRIASPVAITAASPTEANSTLRIRSAR